MTTFKIVIAFALLALVQQASAATPDEIDIPSGSILDPLFGIPMAWGSVPFDKVPDPVYSCDQLRDQPHGYLFLFGSTTREGVTYLLIDGWERVKNDDASKSTAHFEQDVTATIVVVKNGQCTGTISDGYAWSTNQRERSIAISKYGISDEVAAALLGDGCERAIRAFGGARPFLKKLDENLSTTALGQLHYLTNKISSLRKSVARDVP